MSREDRNRLQHAYHGNTQSFCAGDAIPRGQRTGWLPGGTHTSLGNGDARCNIATRGSFENAGNTCFLGATLQCLFHTDE
eukprot:6170042-Prorocentrum_lima.AAC.1